MKKILCALLFAAFCSVCMADHSKIMLKNGKSISMDKVISKDQFGIMVNCGKDTESGETLRRFIPFAEMNPASLALFPFCDVKAVERIDAAVKDRAELLKTKFARRYQEFEGVQDCVKLLKIHGGVPSYEVLFSARETLPNGLIGFLYSDTPSALFYGKIYLHGLKGQKDTVWIGIIYPTEKTLTHKGILYPVFTVIPPKQEKNEYDGGELMDKKENDAKNDRPSIEMKEKQPPHGKQNLRGNRPKVGPRTRGERSRAERPQGGGGNVPASRR